MKAAPLLAVDAVIEGATGLALVAIPGIMAQLLFAAALEGPGLVVARVGGMALIAFSLACWLGRGGGGVRALVVGMLIYNALSGIYFAVVAVGGTLVGILLWPVAVAHVVVAALFAIAWRTRQSDAEPAR